MAPDLVMPPPIEAVIQDFERSEAPFAEVDVQQALGKVRRSLQNPSDGENLGAWAEVLAFALVGTRTQSSPWGTFFGPIGSGTDEYGKTVYFPDIANADAQVIAHWSSRAKTVTHPVLKARYADLAWDMCKAIGGTRRDPQMARLAIDAHLASLPLSVRPQRHDRFGAALRALDLASRIRDSARTERARTALLQLHREVMTAREGQWWFAYDRLIEDKNAGVTEAERQQLINDLEELVLHYGDVSKPASFDPHALQNAAKRLIRHYTRLNRPDDVKRLHEAVARAFEHFASMGDAMLASAVLQTSVNAYRNAGLSEDSKRVRILMQEKIGRARDHMTAFETEIKVSRDDMEEFLKTVVVDDLRSTFVRIAAEFLPNRHHVDE
jgi:lysyl-tRNA synthetase class 1